MISLNPSDTVAAQDPASVKVAPADTVASKSVY